MRVLCVAEKPSIAKAITQILSGGQFTTRQTANKYIKNYDFSYPQTNSFFTVTAVSGHLLEYEFDPLYSKWSDCDPFDLFEAHIYASVTKDMKPVSENLTKEARRAQTLMIWTDCDREGENIGAEIVSICRKSQRNITVNRARFSAIIPQQIHRAAQHPVQLDMAQANAVEARIHLDLRIGAAFTRLQTLKLQHKFEDLKAKVVSYGPCQFPTLGFVVSRYNQVKSFVPEEFWYIFMSFARESPDGNEDETIFSWRRGHLFEFNIAFILYEMVLESPRARVTKVVSKDTKKWKPLPLTTVELQKAGSRLLRMSPKTILDIAERLYQQGFLSYPRTETDRFDPQFDFMYLIDKQMVDPAWGAFATRLQNGGFSRPRQGKRDDKAHPPIHPTAHAGNLAGDEKRVYEFITRRFLACCSKDAVGWETTVDVEYGGEEFYATGLTVRERNYLEVYPYDKWSDKELPQFQQGEEFVPTVCELKTGQTTKPALLTEADLVSMMDKNGIGTDATIAQHIQTIIDREYVIERMHGSTKYLVPSTLGIGLVEGYDAIGFERSMSRPQLRRETERRMMEICEGTRTKADMLTESIEQYKEMFMKTKLEINKLLICVGDRLRNNVQDVESDDTDAAGGGGAGRGGGGGRGGRGARGAGGRRGSRGGRGRGASAGRGVADNDSSDDGWDEGGAPRGRGTRRGAGPSRSAPSRRGRGGRRTAVIPPPPRPENDDSDDCKSEQLRDDTDLDMSADWNEPAPARAPLASARPNNVGPPVLRSGIAPQCDCGVPAVLLTVSKETANKGRQFWRCDNSDGCSFFEWADGLSSGLSAGFSAVANGGLAVPTVVPTKRSINNQDGERRRCACGYTAKLRETTKGANIGKKYWGCPNESIKARCGYFVMADETSGLDVDQERGAYFSNRGSTQGEAVSGECYKCHQEGHWASACPNGELEPSKRSKSNATASAAMGACFKCGQEGHFASACPGSASAQSSTMGGIRCFKCNEEGHYSSACPGTGRKTSATRGSKRGRGARRSSGGITRTNSRRGRKKSSGIAAADDF